jgi:ATP-dependent helicase/nuclease subunit B
LIRRLCALERTRAPFVVEQIETDRLLELGGATLRVRPDRVDRLEDGSRVVLDYKTGAHAQRVDLESARPSHPQLLVYAQVIEPVAALVTVNVAARAVRYQGLARTANLLPRVRALAGSAAGAEAWTLQQQIWHRQVSALIADFLAGRAEVDPRPGACRHCRVSDVCRIREQQTAADEGDDEA